MPKSLTVENLVIERMSYGTGALAHAQDGRVIFVEGAAPGDHVCVEITEQKRNFLRGRILDLLEASPNRVSPSCIHYGECGGCPWGHLAYDAQLQAKEENVRGALQHIAGISKEAAQKLVLPCIPSKRQLGYRNKIEATACFDKRSGLRLGFMDECTHHLVTPASCSLAVKPIEKAISAVQGALRFAFGKTDAGLFRVGLRASVQTGECEVALWTRPGSFPRVRVARVLSSALPTTSIVRVLAEPGKARKIKGLEVLDGHGYWTECLANCSFQTSAPSFFQVNTSQAEHLVQEVCEGIGDVRGLRVVDLYAGGGTFSLPLALRGAQVIAIEAAGSSVRDLRRNAKANKVDIHVVGGDAGRELPACGRVDVLVVDPPRAGLGAGVVELIAAAHPKRVAYVSCNPSTWARDAKRFRDNGYVLISAQPVDLFPQSYHVETVSFFEPA